MLRSSWPSLLKGFAAILCAVGIASLALMYFLPAPPSTITMAVGFKGGSYELLGAQYKEILARSGVELVLRNAAGGAEHFELLRDRNSGVAAAMVQSGITDSAHAPGLLSLGSVNYQIFCAFYRATEVLDDLTELKGKRIAIGPVGSGSRMVVENVLRVSGVTPKTSTLLPVAGQKAVDELVAGTVDAAILGLSSDSPLIQTLLRDPRMRLMSVARAEALTRYFPSLSRVVLPQGAIDFEHKIPASDIVLFSATNSVVVRDDLHPALIGLLAQALVETHTKAGLFQRTGEFPTQTDHEFPMAESATDFYKNGPSFLNRYLPFWMVPHVKRLLAVALAAGAIAYPLFSFAPKLYLWIVRQFMAKLYRRLRVVDQELQSELSEPQVVAMQSDLESIDRASTILPLRHSDLFFDFSGHIASTRARLAARLADLQSPVARLA